jgi:biopolymer transport protein ExbD
LFVNDRPVTTDGLKETLRVEPRESAVVVRADKTTLLEKFVSLVDEVRGLGFQHVSLEVVRL